MKTLTFKIKDYIRFKFNKMIGKTSVCFSAHETWQPIIESSLKKDRRFYFDFESTDNVDTAKFDVFLPLTIDSAIDTNNMAQPVKAVIPSNDCIDLCNNKYQFHKFLCNNGFTDYLPKIHSVTDFPYVLKKIFDIYGENSLIIENAHDEVECKNKINSEEYIKQELISGYNEYTTHIMFYDGEIIYDKTFVFECEQDKFIKGKYFSENVRKEINDLGYLPIFKEILTVIQFQGICCFDYKIKNDKPKIFEINPRVGGSLCKSMSEVLEKYLEIVQDRQRKISSSSN